MQHGIFGVHTLKSNPLVDPRRDLVGDTLGATLTIQTKQLTFLTLCLPVTGMRK